MVLIRWESEQLVTPKIRNVHSSEDAHSEHDSKEHIARQAPSHRGRGIVWTLLESFNVAGLGGNHLCLAYKPMREPL